MSDIAFLTLFLGLTIGYQRVEVAITGPVDRVELQLDARTVAVLRAPTWSAEIDFGDHLVPRRLVARALEANGFELARTEQKINVIRPPAEVQIVLIRDEAGTPRSARVIWQSIDDQPTSAKLSLDGIPLPLHGMSAALPRLDAERPHLLRARVTAPTADAEAEVVFGAGLESESGTSLTAVPIRLRDPRRVPTTSELQQWLAVDGASPRIVAVEETEAELVVVREASADVAHRLGALTGLPPRPITIQSRGDSVRLLFPIVLRTSTVAPSIIFPYSPIYPAATPESLRSVLVSVSYTGPIQGRRRYRDAVALAGLAATGRRRARAVILAIGPEVEDASQYSAAQAREYLRSVGVPLYVWRLTDRPVPDWPEAIDVSSKSRFRRAYQDLRRDLDAQRIVWIEGDHLPDAVTIAAGAPIELASTPSSESRPSRPQSPGVSPGGYLSSPAGRQTAAGVTPALRLRAPFMWFTRRVFLPACRTRRDVRRPRSSGAPRGCPACAVHRGIATAPRRSLGESRPDARR